MFNQVPKGIISVELDSDRGEKDPKIAPNILQQKRI